MLIEFGCKGTKIYPKNGASIALFLKYLFGWVFVAAARQPLWLLFLLLVRYFLLQNSLKKVFLYKFAFVACVRGTFVRLWRLHFKIVLWNFSHLSVRSSS